METTLSSAGTPFWKFLFPSVWIGVFGYGTLMLWLHPEEVVMNGVKGSATPLHQWIFLGGFVFSSWLCWQVCIQLKRVIVTPAGVRISNYITEIVVPLDQVIGVSELPRVQPTVLVMSFRDETEFGEKIRFMPSSAVPKGFLGEHQVTKGFRELVEMREAARAGRSQDPT